MIEGGEGARVGVKALELPCPGAGREVERLVRERDLQLLADVHPPLEVVADVVEGVLLASDLPGGAGKDGQAAEGDLRRGGVLVRADHPVVVDLHDELPIRQGAVRRLGGGVRLAPDDRELVHRVAVRAADIQQIRGTLLDLDIERDLHLVPGDPHRAGHVLERIPRGIRHDTDPLSTLARDVDEPRVLESGPRVDLVAAGAQVHLAVRAHGGHRAAVRQLGPAAVRVAVGIGGEGRQEGLSGDDPVALGPLAVVHHLGHADPVAGRVLLQPVDDPLAALHLHVVDHHIVLGVRGSLVIHSGAVDHLDRLAVVQQGAALEGDAVGHHDRGGVAVAPAAGPVLGLPRGGSEDRLRVALDPGPGAALIGHQDLLADLAGHAIAAHLVDVADAFGELVAALAVGDKPLGLHIQLAADDGACRLRAQADILRLELLRLVLQANGDVLAVLLAVEADLRLAADVRAGRHRRGIVVGEHLVVVGLQSGVGAVAGKEDGEILRAERAVLDHLGDLVRLSRADVPAVESLGAHHHGAGEKLFADQPLLEGGDGVARGDTALAESGGVPLAGSQTGQLLLDPHLAGGVGGLPLSGELHEAALPLRQPGQIRLAVRLPIRQGDDDRREAGRPSLAGVRLDRIGLARRSSRCGGGSRWLRSGSGRRGGSWCSGRWFCGGWRCCGRSSCRRRGRSSGWRRRWSGWLDRSRTSCCWRFGSRLRRSPRLSVGRTAGRSRLCLGRGGRPLQVDWPRSRLRQLRRLHRAATHPWCKARGIRLLDLGRRRHDRRRFRSLVRWLG